MQVLEYALAAVMLLITFWLLIGRRVGSVVTGYAVQSCTLGLLFIAVFLGGAPWHVLVLAASAILIKGVVVPVVLRRQIKRAVYTTRTASYYVGFPTALLIGAALSFLSFLAGGRLPLVRLDLGKEVLGVSIAITVLGLFNTVARREATMQLIGLLVMENGLLLLGVSIGAGLPLLIDFALFLDVLVGAVVMGFLIARMRESASSTDTSELTRLRG